MRQSDTASVDQDVPFHDSDDIWTYVLVTPDAIVGDKLAALVEVLLNSGLTPTACRAVELNLELLRGLYGGRGTHFFVENPGGADVLFPLDLHALLYSTAPACLLMVHRPAGAACQTLVGVKGAVWPEISPPGTLRHLGENAVFNGVHCPDDAESASRELAALVGAPEAQRLRTINEFADGALLDLVSVESFRNGAPVFGGPQATSFPAIANRIYQRVIQRICFSGELDKSTVHGLARTADLLEEQRRALAGTRDGVERMRTARATVPAVATALTTAARAIEDQVFANGISALSHLYNLHGERDVESILAMTRRGLYLSPMEKVVVGSHHYAFRPNTHLCKVYCVH
jgi:nucleoside diphosphate kinase